MQGSITLGGGKLTSAGDMLTESSVLVALIIHANGQHRRMMSALGKSTD
jgi:hypothetical protein